MNNNENKTSNEALADEEMDGVAGGYQFCFVIVHSRSPFYSYALSGQGVKPYFFTRSSRLQGQSFLK